ncbi:MAG: CHASE3 domain-containing protein, partial [Nostoc sp.]
KIYLEPYQTALVNINPTIAELKNLIIDQRSQQKQFAILKSLIAAKLAILKQTIYLRQNQGFDAALQLIQTNQGKNLMDDIREVIYEIEKQDRKLLQYQLQAAKASANDTVLTVAIATCL